MMTRRQWMLLLILFLTYLLMGASIFYHIESRLEIETVEQSRNERIEINALLHEHYIPRYEADPHEILKKLTQYCGKSVYNYSENEVEPLKWDFYNSFYFAYTVVSTIGYGNLAPTNMLSRILMIFYGLIGIPMNGILLAHLGEFFSIVFIRAHQKYKSYKEVNEDECTKKLTPLETRRAGLAVQITMYLLPGFVMFIFFPALLFSYYEGWTYEEAVYYAFVTLTTIGFGDYVAGQDNTKGSGVLFILYKSFLIAWISFGLGYIVMIMTFITRGMRSKKIVRLEQKLAQNLKQTQSKIWSEFNKEVGYLRRVFNELQLSKVKPIYVDEYDYEPPPAKFTRSNSFPDLRELIYGGLPNPTPHPRRRANSEVVPMESPLARVVSESDLQRIDKNATFATHAMVQPAELLARLVNVLGYIPPPADDDEQAMDTETRTGVQCFSDKEILANENDTIDADWKLGGDKIPRGKPRSRAASEVRLDPSFEPNITNNQEWTWSGPAASHKIQEIINARISGAGIQKDRKESKSLFPGLNISKSVPLPRWMKQLSNKREDHQRERNSVSVGDLEDNDNNDLSNNPTFDQSTYFTHTGAANLSSTLEGSNLLEETSLADFLRALTALHTRVGAVPDEYVRKPQRKMGTASLSPPKLPSLLALFSPPPGSSSVPQSNQNTVNSAPNAGRRFSLRTGEDSSSSTPMYYRRNSLAPTIKPRNRRFSLRPVTTSLGTTPQASPYLSGQQRKQYSTVSSPAAYNANSFISESSKEPLVQMEGAPGISSPVKVSNTRRFSLHPAQIDVPSSTNAPITKGMPRWRAGMLQRHINQLSLQRRARAFSLSDVNSSESIKGSDKMTPVSPLALDPAIKTTMISLKDPSNKNSNQKTVTIISPNKDDRGIKSDIKVTMQANQSSTTFARAKTDSNNPFTSIDTNTPFTNPFVIDMSRQYGESSINPSTCEYFANDGNSNVEDRTVFQVLSEVKNIETSPTTIVESSINSDNNLEDLKDLNNEILLDATIGSDEKSIDNTNVSGPLQNILSNTSDLSDKNRNNLTVLMDNQTDGKISSGRKVSTVSEVSSCTESMGSGSRISTSVQCSNEKPRVSIDTYKSLAETKINKLNENPFERYKKVSVHQSTTDTDASSRVEGEPNVSSSISKITQISMDVDKGPQESMS